MEFCQVKVQQGYLQGKKCETFYGKKYYSFEGVPYAKPPIEKLRFRNPEPPEPWRGIHDATKPGNKAMQSNPYSTTTPIDGSEDCLYLNIYTPVLPVEKIQKLPVIFFIHGGRLIFGYGNYYSPEYLIKHDVILVTVNYRLNIFGWLCLNIPECPGNVGLKDIVMALRWIQKNIVYFNGDEKNVTVSGESAGAAMATSLLTSKMAEGLFRKIIAQSGNCIADVFMVEEDPIEKAVKVASILGKKFTNAREIYNFLVQVPVEDLIIAFTEAELDRSRSRINAYFLPVIEKEFDGVERFFTELPRVAIQENRFHKVPILISLNSHESAIFFNENGNIIYEKDFYYFIPQYAKLKRDTPKAKIIENKIREFYFRDKNLDDDDKERYIDMVSDTFFKRDIMVFAENISRYWNQIYVLQFNYEGNMNTRIMKSINMKGTTHGDMIQYLFYRKNKASKASKKDQEIVAFLNEAYYNFAKNGIPTWTNQKVDWLSYSREDKNTLIVDDEITLAKNHCLDRLQFWMDLDKEYADTKGHSKL